ECRNANRRQDVTDVGFEPHPGERCHTAGRSCEPADLRVPTGELLVVRRLDAERKFLFTPDGHPLGEPLLELTFRLAEWIVGRPPRVDVGVDAERDRTLWVCRGEEGG